MTHDVAQTIEDLEFLDDAKVGSVEAASRVGFATAHSMFSWLRKHDALDLWTSLRSHDPEGSDPKQAAVSTAPIVNIPHNTKGPVLDLPVALIQDHPDNPRVVTWKLDDLAASIQQQGVTTPCLVRTVGEGPDARFQLIAGHRRKRAAEMAGLTAIPCLIVRPEESDLWALMLSENVQREQLNPIEEARFYEHLRMDLGLTMLAIANRLGCSEQRVSRHLALLDLSASEQERVLQGKLSLKSAWKMVRDLKPRPGAKPGEGTGRLSKYHEHFNQQHALADEAGTRCDGEGHPVPPRLGPACGECWEETIRDDQHLDTQLDIFGEDEPEMVEKREKASA